MKTKRIKARVKRKAEEKKGIPLPRVGHWEEVTGVLHPLETSGVCSCCGYACSTWQFMTYCPSCGALLRP